MGCFIIGLPSLGPTFCVLSAPATAMACNAALVASATACAIVHLPFYVYLLFCLYLPTRDFYS